MGALVPMAGVQSEASVLQTLLGFPACWAEVRTPRWVLCRPFHLRLFLTLWHHHCQEAPAVWLTVMALTSVLNWDASRAVWRLTWLGNSASFICPLLRLTVFLTFTSLFPPVTCFTAKVVQAVSTFGTEALMSTSSLAWGKDAQQTAWVLVSSNRSQFL